MNNWLFVRRLRREIPVWVAKGWVRPDAEQAILAHAAGAGGTRRFGYAVAVLGVLLLGSGIISFFAANWDAMAKLTKLLVLFGALWLAYGGSAYLRTAKAMPHLSEAVLLLGVVLFGASVMLVAQIYHIDAHYPDGVLLWALGGLLTAYLLDSQAAMIAALVLGTLWTLQEGFGFYDGVHWWYLVFLAAGLPAVIRRHWTFAAHALLIGLLLWTTHLYSVVDLLADQALYLTQFLLLAYLVLYLAGVLLGTGGLAGPIVQPMRRYALVASLLALYALTFPALQERGGWSYGESWHAPAGSAWLALTGAALVAAVVLALWHRRLAGGPQRAGFLKWGLPLVLVGAALVLLNLFVSGRHGTWMAVAFNLLFFSATLWLVFAGLRTRDRFLVNLAFGLFVVALISRYFDTFWTLFDRSLFFMAGGVVLLVGGYFLERQRRRLAQQIAGGRGAGPA